MNSLLLLIMLLTAPYLSTEVQTVGEGIAHFASQNGCVTARIMVSKARPGDAAVPVPWSRGDGSLVRAIVTRKGTVEVERCVCGDAGAASVRVAVIRAKR